jgi:hypothetical protein
MISWYLRHSEKELEVLEEIDVAEGIQSVADEQRQVHGVLFVADSENWQLDPEDEVLVVPYEEVLVLSLRNPRGSAIDNTVEMLESMTRVLIPAEARFDLHLVLAELYEATERPHEKRWHTRRALQEVPTEFDPKRWEKGYQRLDEPINWPPANGTVEPSDGSVPAGDAVLFTTTWSDPDSWADLRACLFIVGSSPGMADKVFLYYDVLENKLYLRSDDGGTWLGGLTPRSRQVVENSQATLRGAGSMVSASGDTIELTWSIEFKPGFVGTHDMYLHCSDLYGDEALWEQKGTSTIQ